NTPLASCSPAPAATANARRTYYRMSSVSPGIEETLHLGERNDLDGTSCESPLRDPKNRAVEEDVLATGKLGMKSRPNLKQAATRPRSTTCPSVGSVMRLKIKPLNP